MDRKQVGILSSLLVLILVIGWGTWQLKDKGLDLDRPVSHDTTKNKENQEDEDTFIRSKIQRDNVMVANMQILEQLIEDESTGDEQREAAQTQLLNMAKQHEMEKDLETELNAKGFKDVLCMVADDFNNVNVYVKSEKDLTEDDMATIRATVVSKTEIREVEISSKA